MLNKVKKMSDEISDIHVNSNAIFYGFGHIVVISDSHPASA